MYNTPNDQTNRPNPTSDDDTTRTGNNNRSQPGSNSQDNDSNRMPGSDTDSER